MLETYWIGNARSLVYVNTWSLVHCLSGILLAWLFPTMTVWTAFWIHTAAEVWQILVRNTPWWTARGQIDVVTDTAFFMLGVYLQRQSASV